MNVTIPASLEEDLLTDSDVSPEALVFSSETPVLGTGNVLVSPAGPNAYQVRPALESLPAKGLVGNVPFFLTPPVGEIPWTLIMSRPGKEETVALPGFDPKHVVTPAA